MALYLGGNSQKINLDGKTYCLNIFTKAIITENPMLLCLNDFILKDKNGLYLTVKEDV